MIFSKKHTIAEKIYAGNTYTENPIGNAAYEVKKKTTPLLIFVWGVSAIMCLLLFFLNESAQNNDIHSFNTFNEKSGHEGLFYKNSSQQKINTNPNDAFVFVKINRQFILTQYPSNQLAESYLTSEKFMQKNVPAHGAVSATKVIRRLKPNSKKMAKNFSIKSIPK